MIQGTGLDGSSAQRLTTGSSGGGVPRKGTTVTGGTGTMAPQQEQQEQTLQSVWQGIASHNNAAKRPTSTAADRMVQGSKKLATLDSANMYDSSTPAKQGGTGEEEKEEEQQIRIMSPQHRTSKALPPIKCPSAATAMYCHNEPLQV